MIVEVRSVGLIRDGFAVIVYEVTRWVACGDGLVLIVENGEIVLKL